MIYLEVELTAGDVLNTYPGLTLAQVEEVLEGVQDALASQEIPLQSMVEEAIEAYLDKDPDTLRPFYPDEDWDSSQPLEEQLPGFAWDRANLEALVFDQQKAEANLQAAKQSDPLVIPADNIGRATHSSKVAVLGAVYPSSRIICSQCCNPFDYNSCEPHHLDVKMEDLITTGNVTMEDRCAKCHHRLDGKE